MIEIPVLLLSAPLWIIVLILGCRHFLHMLQLSSYQFQGYFRYVRQSFVKEWLPLLTAGIIYFITFRWFAHNSAAWLVSSTVYSEWTNGDVIRFYLNNVMCIISVILLIVMIVRFRPKKAKKRFVVTPRVGRLILTLCLLLCIMLLIWCWMVEAKENGVGLTLFFTLLYPMMWIVPVMALPLIVALANLINQPVEKSINNGYIRDAQRILREHPRLKVIGVTGSFGKTSVKYYLTTLLSEQFDVLMTPESYNTPMGIVRTIREQMKPTHEIFVCEMGARHLHDIKEITDFVHPDDGILTAIGEQHLETFHTLDNIISTKYELLDAVAEKSLRQAQSLPPGVGGLKFVNGDNEIIRAHMKYPDAITYGLNAGNDFRATDLAVTPQGTTFNIQLSEHISLPLGVESPGDSQRERFDAQEGVSDQGRKVPPQGADEVSSGRVSAQQTDEVSSPDLTFHTTLVGAHNVQNITGAIAVAMMYGVPVSKIRRAVRRIESVPHRLELKRHGNVTILDDAYNSNPTGAATALDTLALFTEQVKILVTPGMVELGEKEEAYNEAFGTQAASCADYIILVGTKRTEPIARGIRNAGFPEERLFIKETFDEASVLMYELDASKEKVILLENDLPDNY